MPVIQILFRIVGALLIFCLTSCGGGTSNSAMDLQHATSVTYVAPQNGWWWNAAESGSGYAIEQQGNQIFMAAFLYETSGTGTWYTSALTQQPDNSYTGTFTRYQGGQTLLGAYQAPTSTTVVASVWVGFSSSTAGTLVVQPAGGGSSRVVSLSRFPISNPAFATPASSFQNGWWWNASQSGRGFFIEVQGSRAFVAGFMYDGTGQPTWYVSAANVINGNQVSGSLTQYANGQSLAGTYRAPTALAASPGTLSFNLNSSTAGTMTLPNGSTVSLSRFIFNAGSIPAPTQMTIAKALACPVGVTNSGNSDFATALSCLNGSTATGVITGTTTPCNVTFLGTTMQISSPALSVAVGGDGKTLSGGYQAALQSTLNIFNLTIAYITSDYNVSFGGRIAVGSNPIVPLGAAPFVLTVAPFSGGLNVLQCNFTLQ